MKRKKKKTEREVDSWYVEGIIDVEWERNGEREREKKKRAVRKIKIKK